MSLIPWWLKLIAAAAVAAALAWGAHMVMEHWREQGREEVRAELQPQLDQQTKRAEDALAANRSLLADLGTLRAAVARQDAEVARFKARALQAEIAARKAMLAAAQAAAKYDAEIARLVALAGAPNVTEADCAEADRILERVIADGLRDRPE